jgi:hypothetical protein
MARQNRVTPFGEIEATPARGTLMGNRGILHDEAGRLGRRRWQHRRWIACRLQFKSRWRPIMAPRAWTELFFLDEAVALAAGHRPCAQCRYEDHRRFLAAWRRAQGLPEESRLSVEDIDRVLQAARVDPRRRTQLTFPARLADLPDGTFARIGDAAWLLHDGRILRWSHFGYDRAAPVRDIEVQVLTPAPMVAVLSAGYRPALHPTAGDPQDHHPAAGPRAGLC